MLINFDFDGVITDTFDRLFALSIAAQRRVSTGRIPVKQDFRTLENLTFEGLADRLGMPREVIPQFLQTTFELQQEEQGAIRFFPGMATLLKTLSQRSEIAIITSSSADLVRGYLMEHGILDSVDSICGRELGRSKRESILVNIEQFSSSPEQTCMIGDAISDIRYGKAAGVLTIGVGWGFQSSELLLRETPDYLATTPEELLEILRNLGC
jgi:phosphoglycolate phosphatase